MSKHKRRGRSSAREQVWCDQRVDEHLDYGSDETAGGASGHDYGSDETAGGASGHDYGSDETTGHDYKLTQLCAQVEQAVAYALAGSADAALRDLWVIGVTPLRGAAALHVVVQSSTCELNQLDALARRLRRAKGYLRSAVATEIHRKRTPELNFMVEPALNVDWQDEVDE